jgi:hypothetical protein
MPTNNIPVVRPGFIATSQTAITPSAANAWYTVPPITTTLGSSFNNLLIALTWMNSSSPSSTNKNFELAQVQLEEGPTATPFEFIPISTELAMCQRYYEILTADSEGVALTSYAHNTTAPVSNRSRWHFKATKRISPAVNLVSGSWSGVTPTIYPSVESAGFSSAAGLFATSHPVGAPVLYAAAEL